MPAHSCLATTPNPFPCYALIRLPQSRSPVSQSCLDRYARSGSSDNYQGSTGSRPSCLDLRHLLLSDRALIAKPLFTARRLVSSRQQTSNSVLASQCCLVVRGCL